MGFKVGRELRNPGKLWISELWILNGGAVIWANLWSPPTGPERRGLKGLGFMSLRSPGLSIQIGRAAAGLREMEPKPTHKAMV